MRIPQGGYGALLAAVILIIAALVWGRLLTGKSRVTENSLRDTGGMELAVEGMGASPEGIRVAVRLENRTRKTAASVVFTVEAVDDAGRVIMANPLGNALGMQPGESREIEVSIPVPPAMDTSAANSARGRVNLVRWAD